MSTKNEHIKNLLQLYKNINLIQRPVDKINIKEFVDQIASLFSAGNTYYLITNFETLEFEYVSENISNVLDLASNDISLEHFLALMHPEDLKKMLEKEKATLNFKLNKIPKSDITKYKTVYLMRFQMKDDSYKTILHQAKAINISEDGKVFQVIAVHTDISYLNITMDHKISFISDELPCYYSINTGSEFDIQKNNFEFKISPREKDILKEIAKGKSFSDIANILNISPSTVNTHKRNLLKKSNCKNTAELITKCIREGVI